jgi:hypothetical protein
VRRWRRAAAGTVGVELGELAVDVDRMGAVEVDVLVTGGPDVRQRGVVDIPPGGPRGTTPAKAPATVARTPAATIRTVRQDTHPPFRI